MISLEQVLLEYAQEKVVPAYLVGTEYQCSATVMEQLETTLRQMLPEEGQQKKLEDYLTERMLLESMDQEAHFRAGLRIGILLSKL